MQIAGNEYMTKKIVERIPRLFRTAAWLAATAVPSVLAGPAIEMDVQVANGLDVEKATAQRLLELVREYDLSGYMFTRTVRIDRRSIPHSHPVLTLHTRHLGNDELLVSTFVHEQLHWYLAERDSSVDAAITELQKLYPDVPVGYPNGARNRKSTYLHLLVNFLEFEVDKRLFGEEEARELLAAQTHYVWIYEQVLTNSGQMQSIIARHGLQFEAVNPMRSLNDQEVD
jgi:hypothetical protein